MAQLPLLFIVFVAFTGLTEGAGVLPDGPLNAAVNGTFLFSTSLTPTETPFVSLRNLTDADSGEYDVNIIPFTGDALSGRTTLNIYEPVSNVSVLPESADVFEFTSVNLSCSSFGSSISFLWLNDTSEVTASDRVHLTDGGSTLTIVNVTRYDQQPFRCHVFNPVSNGTSDPVNIMVSSHVTNIVVTSDSTDLVEFNSSVSLSCTSSGTLLSFLWLNGSSKVTENDRVQLTDGNSTLTIVNVTRYDQGPFMCQVSNPVSNGTSSPINLSISYGPENIKLMLSSSQELIEEGSNISLSCSAVSRPAALFKWFLNGNLLTDTGPELTLTNIQLSQSGNYSCQAFNSKTLRYQTSQPSAVTVLEKISGASVKPSVTLIVERTSVNLTCEASGSIWTRMWKKNGSDLILTDNMILSDNNRLLSFNPANRNDNGEYFCNISNPVSSDGAKYDLVVNYGPENVQITGPSVLNVKSTLELICSADSIPSASYTWKFSGATILNNSTKFVKEMVDFSDSGNYTCEAKNSITGGSSSAVHGLSVSEQSSGCSAGCIAGIVIACCVLIAGAVGVGFYVYRKKKHPKTSSRRNTSRGDRGKDNTGYSSEVKLSVPLHALNGSWAVGESFILTWLGNQQAVFPGHSGRASVDVLTGALTLSSVTVADSGVYVVQSTDPQLKANASITVLDGPDNMALTVNGQNTTSFSAGSNLTILCSSQSNPPAQLQWAFRGEFVKVTGPLLELSHVSEDQSGPYSCLAFNNYTNMHDNITTHIVIANAIENVQVEAPDNLATVGYSYNLTCNVTGPADHVYWMKNGELLHEDNTTVFSTDNKTVSFIPLNRYDTGYYQCVAVNAVEKVTSAPHMLLVNFGPETPIIQGPAYAETGGYAIFNCSAMSVPPSHFSWWYNGSMVANTSVFTAGPLSLNMTGEYTCVAYNYVTEKNSTNSAMLTVIEAIESVKIQSSTIPIQYENFTLTCDVVGPYDTIYWMKDNITLNSTNPDSSYHIEKNMLYFSPLIFGYFTSETYWTNDGSYQCVATNQAGQHKSEPYQLLVNYGPVSVTISGSDSAELGTSGVSLTCSAVSQPECHFYWFLNNQSNPLTNGSVITFSVTKESEGTYICKARNPVTNITLYQNHTFAISDHASAIHFSSHGSLMLMGLFAFSTSVLFN
ncbi:carcinoembryonic antigen-related cell adhesion molecule 5-like [Acanthochromis polyacanthus]|uniref:carcinoembryonic antigen-related cell adhesion molecule 5-like n=1 Tax=Acanthochromis polyacanthus TaxID=80966 RepID=UPI00223481C0|nr:carcinoembryonic antigen-related cell adhesion molecule 5-like [Acanthochromis polyacanthus]